MSQEDAATIRRAYEVWNESGPAAVVEQSWAEDAVCREGPGWPDAGVGRMDGDATSYGGIRRRGRSAAVPPFLESGTLRRPSSEVGVPASLRTWAHTAGCAYGCV